MATGTRFLGFKIQIGVSIVDPFIILLFWLCSGISQDESLMLKTSVDNFTFDSSLFDVVILGFVRGLLLCLCYLNVPRYLSTLLLKITAAFVSTFSLLYLIIKSIFFMVNHDHLANTPGWVATILTFSFIFVLIEVYGSIYLPISYSLIAGDIDRYEPINSTTDEESHPQTSKDYSGKDTLKRVLMLAIPQWRLLLTGLVALFISSASMLAIPALFGIVITATTEGNQSKLNEAIIWLIGVFVVGSAASFVRAWTFTWAGQRLVCQLRQNVFAAIVIQDIAFFDITRTGELTSRLASDTAVIQNAATVNISMLVRYTIQIIGAVGLLFYYSWELTLIMLSVVPIVAIGAVTYGKYVKKLSKEFQDQLGAAGTTAEEAFSNIRTVRSFSREDASIKQYFADIYKSYEIGFKMALAQGGFAGVLSLLAQLAIGLVLYVGGRQVLKGQLSTGNLTSFLLYTLTLAMGFAFLSSLFGEFMTAAGASTRIFQLMDKKPQIPQSGGVQLNQLNGEIKLENVSFKYPSRDEVAVLTNINLSLVPGTVTALVGPSGGGKTTIVSLIERYYDPIQGRVLLDNTDIKEFDPKWYRQQIGFVSQEPVLFGCSIGENISYGIHRNVAPEELEAVAREANAIEFIDKMPERFATVVGERGVRLSGGQKQRIAIARALLMNPSILLLDEATSALDAESEHLVQEAIDRAMKKRTVLVVAHRLSTVRNANCVLVVKDGQIAESGTHDELMKTPTGIYRKLVKRQLQG